MQGVLNEINENQVLKYLGYRGGQIENQLKEDIARISREVIEKARPSVTFQVFGIEWGENPHIAGTNFALLGENIKEMLKDCHQCILMGATLGMAIEQELRSRQVQNVYESMIFDSCASSAIENVCDNLCSFIEEKKSESKEFLTDRFSPGYGDMPFEQQKEICTILRTEKTIGVSLSQSGIMIPRKSVTAVMGISYKEQSKRFRGCEYCSSFHNCRFRKGGTSCGKVS
ncbi:MAG TPA: vitamin B12 dependent-methionine synthase activation domain-containing protein [Lachnospiraceae bacterium]